MTIETMGWESSLSKNYKRLWIESARTHTHTLPDIDDHGRHVYIASPTLCIMASWMT